MKCFDETGTGEKAYVFKKFNIVFKIFNICCQKKSCFGALILCTYRYTVILITTRSNASELMAIEIMSDVSLSVICVNRAL